MVVLFLGFMWQPYALAVGTFKQQLQVAAEHFQAGDYGQAHAAFESLELVFGKEPEFRDVQATILPLHGYACLITGDYSKAVALLETFMTQYPEAKQRRGFMLYTLAQAYQGAGQYQPAIDTYQAFIDASPHTPEAAMSMMRQAELYFKLGQDNIGIEQLLALANSHKVAPSLQNQARLRALQQAQVAQDTARSLDIMFSKPWSITAMPELAILTFAALRAGDDAIAHKRYQDALRAYRLVPPLDVLIQAQKEKLQQLTATFKKRQAQAKRGHLQRNAWDEHYQKIIRRVTQQLEVLTTSDDYTPGFQLRMGQAFLLSNRPREARLLFKHLAEQADIDEAIQIQAYYHWVLAANALEEWDSARTIAQLQVARFPNDELSQQALFLVASAHQQRKQYSEAVQLLSELLKAYPQNRYVPRWLYTRGLNHTFLQDYEHARDDFNGYMKTYHEGTLFANAQLWRALTFFFEKEYQQAIELLKKQKQQLSEAHPLYPEIEYRIATTYYAQQEHILALQAVNSFIKKYHQHPRAPTAQALLGDIFMAQGELQAALAAFEQVSQEAGSMFTYSIFQAGKIYRALEDYDALIRHFKAYVALEGFPTKTRIAEALYWVGWAYMKKQDVVHAFPLFMDALQRYGNDIQVGDASAIAGILKALRNIHQHYHRIAASSLSDEGLNNTLIQNPDFDVWLKLEKSTASEKQAWTYYARLNLYAAQYLEQEKRPLASDACLYDIIDCVPNSALDAEGLAQVGMLLFENNSPVAEDYFERLLETFPQAPQRAIAYYYLARLRWQENQHEATEKWLNRFNIETPYHSLNIEATLLMGEVLTKLNKYDKAIPLMEDLLRLKLARGRPHARALSQLAKIHKAQGKSEQSIAYYQRIYTLYPAYQDLAASAYYESALIFVELDNAIAADNTLNEMFNTPNIQQAAEYEQAMVLKQTLHEFYKLNSEHQPIRRSINQVNTMNIE